LEQASKTANSLVSKKFQGEIVVFLTNMTEGGPFKTSQQRQNTWIL
jgi:hypothetical protein